jgi:hypothetical protein
MEFRISDFGLVRSPQTNFGAQCKTGVLARCSHMKAAEERSFGGEEIDKSEVQRFVGKIGNAAYSGSVSLYLDPTISSSERFFAKLDRSHWQAQTR